MTSALISKPRTEAVRVGTAADIPALVAMGQAFLRASPYAQVIIENPAQMAAAGTWLLSDPAERTMLVVERAGAPVGMLGLLIFPHPLSGERMAGELFWWVDPGARGTAGLRLLRAAEAWARDHQAVKLQMIAPDAAVSQLYERLAFTYVESSYQKSL